MMAGRRRLSSGEGRRRDGQGEGEGKGGEDGPEEPGEGESAGSKTKGSLSRTYWGNHPDVSLRGEKMYPLPPLLKFLPAFMPLPHSLRPTHSSNRVLSAAATF
jgi:hypothetical protein